MTHQEKEEAVREHTARELKVGDVVLARDLDGTWREAWLDRHAPYSSRGKFISDGWRIRWKVARKAPIYDPYFMPSEGGWKPINCIQKLCFYCGGAHPSDTCRSPERDEWWRDEREAIR